MEDTRGLAKHPQYFGAKIEPGMKLPGDTRLFRDIKLYEIPQWLMKRDFSPLGMYFWFKRFKHGLHTKYLLKRNVGGNFFAMTAVIAGLGFYMMTYPAAKHEKMRRYH